MIITVGSNLLPCFIPACVKDVMSKRYNPATGCLDMSRFHNDPTFLGQEVYVPLARSSVMSNVIKIINENVPQVGFRWNEKGLIPPYVSVFRIEMPSKLSLPT